MKNKKILYTLLLIFVTFMSGCSTMAYVKAKNGKTYYIDTAVCETYKLEGNSMQCRPYYTCDQVVTYQPIIEDCNLNTCGSSCSTNY